MKSGNSVLGYVFFHRHGHRAPAKNIFKSAQEVKIWESLLPDIDIIQNLSSKYPVKFHESLTNGTQPDCKTKPFGYLTRQGVEYMQQIGQKTRHTFPSLMSISSIEAFSTHYGRTQISAQSFLSGLNAPDTPIMVRDQKVCAMSFFEGQMDLAVALTRKVQGMPSFQEKEHRTMEKIGFNLLTVIPELRTIRPSVFKPLATPSSSGAVATDTSAISEDTRELKDSSSYRLQRSETEIVNWMAAIDYFHCRKAHSVSMRSELLDLEKPLEAYVSSRYRDYFCDSEHRLHSVLPLLEDAYGAVQRIIDKRDKASTNGGVDVTVFSGHDVNIFGLLHALDAAVVRGDIDDGVGGHWPDYGSVLAFEVVANNSDDKADGALGNCSDVERLTEKTGHYTNHGKIRLNVYYNHQPLHFRINDEDNVTSLSVDQLSSILGGGVESCKAE